MPIFEYKCLACSGEFENIEFSDEDKPKECPDCKNTELVKSISVTSEPKFVGSGFYATDYKSKLRGRD